MLTVQHEATKVIRKTWRRVTEMKLAWLYPTKVKKLQPKVNKQVITKKIKNLRKK